MGGLRWLRWLVFWDGGEDLESGNGDDDRGDEWRGRLGRGRRGSRGGGREEVVVSEEVVLKGLFGCVSGDAKDRSGENEKGVDEVKEEREEKRSDKFGV